MNISHYTEERRNRLLKIMKARNITLEDILTGREWIGRKHLIDAKCEYWKRNHCYYQQEKV